MKCSCDWILLDLMTFIVMSLFIKYIIFLSAILIGKLKRNLNNFFSCDSGGA